MYSGGVHELTQLLMSDTSLNLTGTTTVKTGITATTETVSAKPTATNSVNVNMVYNTLTKTQFVVQAVDCMLERY
jgi:hypothetical protein